MTTLDFYFDFGSPTAFLAYERLLQLQAEYDLKINFKPMLLGGVFKATHNQSPVSIPAKGMYMMKHDLPRFAKRYGVELTMNPNFPINTLPLMRGAYAALELGCFDKYCRTIFDAMWKQGANLGDPAVIKSTLDEADLDSDKLIALTQDQSIKDKLADTTTEAVSKGAFGAPTMFVGDEMFFGQDRLDFIEELLK
ncbi:MAG: 2-hydroxychromene-2-carboxylate isomerase [Pseudomonadales bacterium]|nr:2-hydroxychromene-2-carboxylate isomerase [Pseudomonadales bacterium]